ncbi:MAG: hypothetical protein AAGF12_22115 [Myxococcota bacterium]
MIALADPERRHGILAESAQHLLDVAYGPSAALLGSPFEPVYERFELGVRVAPTGASLEGSLQAPDGSPAYAVHLALRGLGHQTPAIDAVWRGGIVGTVVTGNRRIAAVTTASAPPEPGFSHRRDLTIEHGAPSSADDLPRHLPLTVALVGRGVDEPLAALLARSGEVRAQVTQRGEAARALPELPLRYPVVVAWVVEADQLDSFRPANGEPDTTPVRLAYARRLFAPQGIAIVLIP